MKKLFSKIFLLILLVCISIIAIVALTPRDYDSYFAAAIDKHQLISKVPSPRIILVGGSNVAFSIDSEKIEKEFGIPVVNMGLHVDLGLKFEINEILPFIRAGDIVIIMPEYSQFSGPRPIQGQTKILGAVIKVCPQCITGVQTPSQIGEIIVGILQTEENDLLRGFTRLPVNTGPYLRKGFNRNGDMIGHLRLPPRKISDIETELKEFNPKTTISFLNSAYQQMKNKNARVYFMFPGFRMTKEFYAAGAASMKSLYTQLQSDLDFPILGKPDDFIFPTEDFYDSGYHMNKIGRQKRTDRMIELLLTVIPAD